MLNEQSLPMITFSRFVAWASVTRTQDLLIANKRYTTELPGIAKQTIYDRATRDCKASDIRQSYQGLQSKRYTTELPGIAKQTIYDSVTRECKANDIRQSYQGLQSKRYTTALPRIAKQTIYDGATRKSSVYNKEVTMLNISCKIFKMRSCFTSGVGKIKKNLHFHETKNVKHK
jgi:hypothetical protein